MKEKVNWINWQKIIVLFIMILLIFVLIYFTMIYRSILQSKTEGIEQTEAVISDTLNMQVDDMYFFQEEQSYHIAYASNEERQDSLVFVPLNEDLKKENFIVIERDAILSQAEIENNWTTECTQCELINSTPAMIDNIPLWELTYKDNANRYVIEYITLKDGSIYEQLRLSRKYSEKG